MNIKFLKEDGSDFETGDTITIESTIEGRAPFDETRSLTDPASVEITIEDTYNSTILVDGASMTKESTGQYFYNYNTNGEDPGDRKVTVRASQNGTVDKEIDWLRIQNTS